MLSRTQRRRLQRKHPRPEQMLDRLRDWHAEGQGPLEARQGPASNVEASPADRLSGAATLPADEPDES